MEVTPNIRDSFTFRDSVPSQGIQLPDLVLGSTKTSGSKGEVRHSSFNQPGANRVDADIRFLELISRRLSHIVNANAMNSATVFAI